MGVIIRQSIKSTIFSYLGVVIGVVNVLWLYPEFLNQADIGLLSSLYAAAAMFAPFAQLGMGSVITRFFPKFNEEEVQQNQFLLLTFISSFFGFILISILILFFQDNVISHFSGSSDKNLLITNYHLIVALLFCFVFSGILESYSKSLLKIAFPIFLKDVLIRLMITALLTSYAFGLVVHGHFFQLYVLIYVIALLVLLLYVLTLRKIRFQSGTILLSKKVIKSIGIYSFFVVLAGTSTSIVQKIDTLMISGLMKSFSEAGIYTIAFYIGNVIEMPRRSIISISQPLIAKAWHNNDTAEIAVLYKKTSLNLLIIGVLIFIGIWVNVDNLFRIIPKGEIYSQGKFVVLFIGIAKILDMITGINHEIIFFSNYYRFNVILMMFLVFIAFVSNYILIPLYGISGAAIATAISYLLFNLIKSYFVWYKFKMQPFTANTLYILFLGGILILLGEIAPNFSNPYGDLIFRSAIVFVLFNLVVYIFKLSDEYINLINTVKKKLLY